MDMMTNATEAPSLSWRRTSDGLVAEHPLTGVVYELRRHHVDDRKLDGGYVHTWWIVVVDGDHVAQEGDQASARTYAEESARRRLVREAREGRVFVRSAGTRRLPGRCELVTVDPDTLAEAVIGAEPTRQGATARAAG